MRFALSCNLPAPRSRNFLKGPAVAVEQRVFSGELLPPEHGHVDIPWIDLYAEADSADALGCNQAAAASKEWVIASLPWTRVVQNRPPHDFDRFLRAMAGRFVFHGGVPTKRIQIRYFPDGCLLAIAAPASGPAFPHRIPAGSWRQ
jgi:hypothetical protein